MVKTEFVVICQGGYICQEDYSCGKYEDLREKFDDLDDALKFRIEKKNTKGYKNIDIIARCIIEVLM
ncbi:hypothetical protein QEW_4549 [Clostridioides difficile CD160]|nr:hypothetical protein QEW_4549 [Clostridioides difficile CD160]